jgi:hypothetical protein
MKTQWYHFFNPIKKLVDIIIGIRAWGGFRP